MKAKTTHGPLALVLVLAALARRSPPVAAVMTTMTSQSRRPPRPPPRPRAAAAVAWSRRVHAGRQPVDFRIEAPTPTVQAGMVTFNVTNGAQ